MKTSATITALLLAVSLLLAAPAAAQTKQDAFDLYIAPTLDERLDSWLKMPPELQPTIHLVENIYPGQPFSLRLLFRNYALSPLNNAHITYDVQFFGPDGEPTADRGEDLLGFQGSVKGSHYIIINQQLLRVFFDDSYPFGEYRIVVTATDHQAKRTAVKSGTISFLPFERRGNFVSFDFFTFWMRNYFRQPDVGKALFGLLQYFEKDLDWMQQNTALLAFADRLLEDNPWIWDHLARHYNATPEDRDGIIALMAINRYRIPALTDTFDEEQAAWHAAAATMAPPETTTTATAPRQLDSLWGDFYATGHIAPVERIVRLLRPFAPDVATDSTAETVDRKAYRTLVENGREVPVVASYCSYLLEHGEVSPQNMAQLRLALEVIKKSLEEDKKNAPTSSEIGVPLRN